MKTSRRTVLKVVGVSSLIPSIALQATDAKNYMARRIIPSTGELLPVIGLGTSRVFDTNLSEKSLNPRKEIVKALLDHGGSLIDTSPMYGRAEEVTGKIAQDLKINDRLFLATKVWIEGKEAGEIQMNASSKKLNKAVIDLMQIHNLLDWKTHIKTLYEWKEQGKINYIGISHFRSNAFNQIEKIITKERIDFAQFNYSLEEREAEKRLLPLCREKGVATLINRPFMRGKLFKAVARKKLPSWTYEYNVNTWSQFFLKFILANQAVTTVIPATSNPAHMIDNLIGGIGPIPEVGLQKKMVEVVAG
ncbi:MAG TPA: aldo/keto reductase [Gammaproteobacteria bacterium]|nr:aldo/keto reductase [Gammaproteobacteria bacterium]